MKLLLSVATAALVIIAAFDVGVLIVTQPKPAAAFKERWQEPRILHTIPKEPRIVRVIPVTNKGDKIFDRLLPEPDSQPEKASDRIEHTFATVLLQPTEPEHEHYRHRRRHRGRD